MTVPGDLAQALATVALRMARDPQAPTGTFHGVNAGEATWCDLANHVFDVAARHGRPRPGVTAIATRDYPTPARRPANSRLSTRTLAEAYGVTLRPWQQAVEEIVATLVA